MASSIGQPAFLGFCPTCNKALTRETAYNRHISYCRRAQAKNKGRPKSCVACSASKVKCTFTEPQCARCEAKGIPCVYIQSRQQALTSHIPDLPPSLDLLPADSHLTPTLTLDESFWDINPFLDQQKDFRGISMGEYSNFSPSASLSFPFQTPIPPEAPMGVFSRFGPPKNVLTLTRKDHQDLAVDYISDHIIFIIKAFPRMMLRRETFPPFIHPYWHWPTLPEELASCMSIAQLFEGRTAESRPFLWRVIDAEEQRFREGTATMSMYKIQWASQALMTYIMMAIVDEAGDHTVRGKRLLKTLETLSLRFHVLLDCGFCSTTELARPSQTWDDWIFAETNRRIGCLWFVICRVFTTHDHPCPGLQPFEKIALVSPKTVWEARTEEQWQGEKAIHDISCPFVEFGDLIAAKRRPNDTGNAQRLEMWEAGTDKLGLLMNFAVAFV